LVLYPSIQANITFPLTGPKLACLPIASARNPEVGKGKDGISYLLAAKSAGILTPLTQEYESAILELTGIKHARGCPFVAGSIEMRALVTSCYCGPREQSGARRDPVDLSVRESAQRIALGRLRIMVCSSEEALPALDQSP
jgi:hypothetical protein